MTFPRQKRPCAECPWRLDVEPGQFPAERYAALRATTVGDDGYHAGLDAPLFACHKSPAGGEFACAGWLAAAGAENVRVRLAVAFGELPAEALRPGDGWPPLCETYDEMADLMGSRTLDDPCRNRYGESANRDEGENDGHD